MNEPLFFSCKIGLKKLFIAWVYTMQSLWKGWEVGLCVCVCVCVGQKMVIIKIKYGSTYFTYLILNLRVIHIMPRIPDFMMSGSLILSLQSKEIYTGLTCIFMSKLLFFFSSLSLSPVMFLFSSVDFITSYISDELCRRD